MVSFNNAEISQTLQNKKKLKEKIAEIVAFNLLSLKSLSYVFCSDEYLLKINRQFLHHDYYTDIITFDLSDKKGTVDGEIYISIDRVRENAVTENTSVKHELHRVIFHGVLHLCGFNDKKKKDKIVMRNAENFWLNNYLSST